LSVKPKILYVCSQTDGDNVPNVLAEQFELTEVGTPLQALSELTRDDYAGIYIDASQTCEATNLGHHLQNARTLDTMADGVALLNPDNVVMWANQRLIEWAPNDPIGANFYACLNNPEILGPDYCPFSTVLATGCSSSSTLRLNDNRYYQIQAAPILEEDGAAEHIIVTIRDVTLEMLQQQKLNAIHRAGQELADLAPEEVLNMTVEDRVELLKSNILHYTQDLLHFDVVEIRLLDQKTGNLEPLLSVGIQDEAANRQLHAHTQKNGVTGFVAATGKSYLCEDTAEDPLYIEGFEGAKSSLTVPLLLHDEVIGTFNVESPETRAFSESDLQFLEIFSRDVAVALNTLELLVAQSANTALESVEAIHSAVALPIDQILNDAVNVMERYIGHDTDVVERLQHILRNARDIKRVIQKIGEKMAPTQAVLASNADPHREKFRERRVLVVDADQSVRLHAHDLLERYGCLVETAHDATEALCMVRNAPEEHSYHAVISDIRLPDMSGHQLYIRLQDLMDPCPMVLMTGFGYDPGHSIVKARQAGLHPKGILYKPFRLDQLLETIETIMASADVTRA